jgi:hypothetical protein
MDSEFPAVCKTRRTRVRVRLVLYDAISNVPQSGADSLSQQSRAVMEM